LRLDSILARSLLAVLAALAPAAARGDRIQARYPEGLVHGFLTLRGVDGSVLADGDLIQYLRGGRVTSRLLLKFRDGSSVHDETTVFTQDGEFRLVSDRLVQKGPAFEKPMEVSVDVKTGMVTVQYTDDGKAKTVSEHMDLPPDLANGMVLTLIKNLDPKVPLTTVSMVAATPKPRLVKLAISPAGEEPFTVGGGQRKATCFVVHIELGGLAGLVAPLIGKQPPDTYVWVLEGDAPAFIGSRGPLAMGGPPWRLELASPTSPAGKEDRPR
jgi:hypothetical protein